MARVAKKQKTLKYVLTGDLYDQNPFTLKLKPISALKLANLEDKVSAYHNREGVIFMNNQQFYYNICKQGIVGWSNLIDEDNENIQPVFENDILTDESLNYIISDIEEIGSVINAITRNPASIATYEALTEKIQEEMKLKDSTEESMDEHKKEQ